MKSKQEAIVDSRVKLLANNFQEQLEDLKGRTEVNDSSNKGVEGKRKHGIKKREAKTVKPKKPVCESSASLCTFFFPDHPDTGRKKGSYSPIVTNDMQHNPAAQVKGMPTS